MKCKGPRATRRHFGLPTNCVAVPETDCFYRDCLKDTWVLVKEIVLRDRAVWLRYAHVMVKENTPGADKSAAEKTTDAAAEQTTDAAAEKTTDSAAEKTTDAADKQTDTQTTAAAAAGTSNGEAGAEAQTG